MKKTVKTAAKIVKKPAAKSVTSKKNEENTPVEKKVRKQAKSLKLVKKISTAEGLERIRLKKGKK